MLPWRFSAQLMTLHTSTRKQVLTDPERRVTTPGCVKDFTLGGFAC